MFYLVGLSLSFVFILFTFFYKVNSQIQSTKTVQYCMDTPDNFTICCEEIYRNYGNVDLKKCNSLITKELLNVTNVRVEVK